MRSTGIPEFDARLMAFAARKQRFLDILGEGKIAPEELWARLVTLALGTADIKFPGARRGRGQPPWNLRVLGALDLLQQLYEEHTGRGRRSLGRWRLIWTARAADAGPHGALIPASLR